MNFIKASFCALILLSLYSYGQADKPKEVAPPKTYGAVPSERQLTWHEMEMYNMIEFSTIQYLEEKDWGWGNEDPALVNPSKFNAEDIVMRAKDAGFKGFLVQAKHHGGFCMWPTKTTDYNISKTPFRNGNGDWIGEWAAACRKHGLKFGVYCSPWDRSTDKFGKPEYLEMFKQQLRELMTNYGDLFIVWFDGAPGDGGDGYYGGKNEYRGFSLGKYYPWPEIYALVRELQPKATIFNDPGPDVRWVGNENGYAPATCWSTIGGLEHPWNGLPGGKNEHYRGVCQRFGTNWVPAECDVSLRRRFTYHASDNFSVKTPQKLFDIYINSVGRGQCLDLNLPINREGQQDESDKKSLIEFGEYLHKTFGTNLAKGCKIKASNVRGNDKTRFGTNNLLDEDRYSYWATDDNVISPEITVELPKENTFNIIKLRENIKLGQRIDSVDVDAWIDGSWKRIAEATSIGACRIIRLKNYIQSNKLRLKLYSPVCIALSEFGLFAEPESEAAPIIKRNKEGMINITTSSPVSSVHYTLDETEPNATSMIYSNPFKCENQVTVRAGVFNSKGKCGEIATKTFDISKQNWTILELGTIQKQNTNTLIDDNEDTFWDSKKEKERNLPLSVAIDMGKIETISSFSYTPRQDGKSEGVVDDYEYYTSYDGLKWEKVAEGKFPNLRNSPVYRAVPLKKAVSCRYFKFVANHVLDGNCVTIAELGARRE